MIVIKESKDASLLAELNEEVQTLHHILYPDVFKPYNRVATIESFKKMLKQGNVIALVAYYHNDPAGYVVCSTFKHKENVFQHAYSTLYIDQISVREKHRMHGVGSQLLEAIKSLAKTLKIERVQLDHWTKNEGARAFFKRSGFEYYNEKMELWV
ncbi:MAG: hypothetical protein DHS20C18_39010 [Saprospiraceae bacterium]|nr:MAG: hypothetical protein DHS20C18_39010 [Saprospiraceae bacterium]